MPPLLPPAGPPGSVSMTMCLRATALLPQLRPHSRWEEGSSLLDLSDPRAAGAPLPWQPAQHMCVLEGLSQSPAATGNPVPSSPPSSARALGSQANCGLLLLSSVLESEQTRALTVDLLCDLGKAFNRSEPWFASLQNGRCRFCGENPRRGGHKGPGARGQLVDSAAARWLVPTPGQAAPLGTPFW